MANIAKTDVTYVEAGYPKRRLEGMPPRFKNQVTVSFGNGVLTYGPTGIPLDGNKLGMPSGVVEVIEFLDLTGGGGPALWVFDVTNGTIRGYTTDVGALNELAGAIAATTLKLEVEGY
jgi:hypothetical protein